MFYTGPPERHGGNVYSVNVEADDRWPPPYKILTETAFLSKNLDYGGCNAFTEVGLGNSVVKF
jgi:hypothetical protein